MELSSLIRSLIILTYLTQKEIFAKQRSLAFVFDTTASMGNDLENFKKGANLILDSHYNHKNSGISNYILVPFNDPGFGPLTVTKNERVFRTEINNIKLEGGGDCAEMCLSALKTALQAVSSNSYIYVMTDSSEKDTYLKNEVIKLAQIKESEITFLSTGEYCATKGETFSEIASKSSGLVLRLKEASDIYKILKYINEKLDSDISQIITKQNPKGYNNKLEVNVDKTMSNVSVLLAGSYPKLDVINPKNKIVTDRNKVVETLNLDNVKAVDIINAEAGTWNLRYGSNEKHTIKVFGLTGIEFEHGFSQSRGKNIAETTKEPLKGHKNIIVIAVKRGTESVKTLNDVEFYDISGKLLKKVMLINIYNPKNGKIFESVEFFYPPDRPFTLKITGEDTNGNKITRDSNTVIEQRDPGAPTVTTDSVIEAKMNQKVELKCKANSLIPVSIRWYKSQRPLDDYEEYMQTGEIVYEIERMDRNSAGIYTCVAWNDKGSGKSNTKVIIPGVKTIDNVPYQEKAEPMEFDIESLE